MTQSLYDHGRNEFALGNIDWVNDTIHAVLIDTDDYTVDLANHQNFDEVPAAARVADAALSGKATLGDGTVDADDLTWSSVSGDQSEAVLYYKNTGNEATSTLIGYDDESTGLPVDPNGGDIVLAFNASGIFKL